MKRREFIQSTAAAAAASVLPAAALAATTPAQDTAPPLDAEVTRLRIGTHRTGDLREANRLAREAGKPLRRLSVCYRRAAGQADDPAPPHVAKKEEQAAGGGRPLEVPVYFRW